MPPPTHRPRSLGALALAGLAAVGAAVVVEARRRDLGPAFQWFYSVAVQQLYGDSHRMYNHRFRQCRFERRAFQRIVYRIFLRRDLLFVSL